MSGPRIIAARRTAVMPARGAFARLRVEDMAAPVIGALLSDAGIASDAVDEVICAEAIGQGGNPARRIALAAGLPEPVAGLSIDRQCAGGLDAIRLGFALIATGMAEVVIAGGVESQSLRPLRARADPAGGPHVPYDQAPFTPWPSRDPDMTEAADALARDLGITRNDQDSLAVESHARAMAVAEWPEILPLAGVDRDGFTRALHSRIAARAPVLAGSVTAANAAVAADGAAFVLIVSERLARGRGLRLLGSATLGDRPECPGIAPVAAIHAALGQAGLPPDDLEQVELMEAYAAQALACIRGADLPVSRINPKGGGLARGHPIGASGAILAVRLFHDLAKGPGLAAIAAAGGIASALVVQR